MNTRDFARALGKKGGLARAKRLSFEERKKIASLGGQSRARSIQAARRIAENFQYLDTIIELTGKTKVTRHSNFKGQLPKKYD